MCFVRLYICGRMTCHLSLIVRCTTVSSCPSVEELGPRGIISHLRSSPLVLLRQQHLTSTPSHCKFFSTRRGHSQAEGCSNVDDSCRTYNMNDLQGLPESRHGSIFVTLNPPSEVDPSKVVGRYKYEHPMYSAAVSAGFASL